ncbi:MAG: hypothetical protein CMH59_07055, partial [Myxococcales bacterium]|nr:hypothetical protein [Myxococcales bacterium]
EALDGVTQLVVSADAGTPLARLRRLLAALPEAASRDVVLAVPLPEDVRLPDAPSPADADDLLCGEEGLPASSGPLGELAPAQLLETLRPFHQEASACFAQASAEAAEGGRLVLHFRVGPDGAVQAACAREDDLGDPALRRCVVSRLSALRFPAPDPPGHVDAALPLVFRPDRSAAPRALCP